MSLKELEEYEDQMMIKNVTCIAEDVRQRIDDEPGPGGCFMQAFLTPMKGKTKCSFQIFVTSLETFAERLSGIGDSIGISCDS